MADVELIIKISEEKYDTIKSDRYNTFPAVMKEWGLEAIRNGAPIIETDVDTISRQQAIDKMQELEDEDIKAYGCEIPEGFDGRRAIKALKILPPIKPKTEKGHWIEGENGPYCDNCGNGVGICYKFCPFCGRDMREYT